MMVAMKHPTDLKGMRFGRLLVLKETPRIRGKRMWATICDCGKRTLKQHHCLTLGNSKSCGCLQYENLLKSHTTHGLTGTKIAKTWEWIKARCLNKKSSYFHRYGGRGIGICQNILRGPHVLLKILGERPEKFSIERKNNDLGYTCGKCKECRSKGWPLNIKWASMKEQLRNTQRNRLMTIGGKTKCAIEWAELAGVKPVTFYSRINKLGWTPERAISRTLKKGEW